MKVRLKINDLVCCLAFVFWAFIYPNHILMNEQLSLFLYRWDFWTQYALQPGGWSAYCGQFLAQFYFNRWLGALIQTVFVYVLLSLSKRILKKMGAKGNLLLTGLFPALILTALQCDNHFTPGDSLALSAPFALMLLYLNIRQALSRRIACTLAIVPVFLFFGAAATCCLYAACSLYELLFARDSWKYATPVWLLAAGLLPYIWQSVYLTPNETLFDILSFTLDKGIRYVPYILLIFTPFYVIASAISFRRRLAVATFNKSSRRQMTVRPFHIFYTILLLLLWIGCGYYLFSNTYNRIEEQKFGMDIAASRNDWDRVLKISERVEKPDKHVIFYTNLALAIKRELPNKMFRYAQIDESGLLLTRIWDDFNLRYGSAFFYHIGILNEAIRWIFDAHIDRSRGMDYHTLTRLAVWSQENGDMQVADKYFDLLEGTLMYRSFAKHQRKAGIPENKISSVTPKEFYIGGREPVTDMAWHYENFPENWMTADYLLCYLLLKTDLDKFLALFKMCYKPSSNEMPQAYQEALLFLAGDGKINIRDYPIPQATIQRYLSFNSMVNKGKDNELQKQFGDTWCWYSYRKKPSKNDNLAPIKKQYE